MIGLMVGCGGSKGPLWLKETIDSYKVIWKVKNGCTTDVPRLKDSEVEFIFLGVSYYTQPIAKKTLCD
jgi:hypothetical protein